MTQLETLIQTLCPNGVKFVKLGEVAEVGTGRSNGNEAIETGEYPFFVRSKDVKRLDKFEFDEEAIIIPGEGGIGEIFHYINGKYALHQRVYRIHFLTNEVNVKFAYFYMSAMFKSYIMMKAVSATVTSIRKPMIENFQIPLPPLAVQSEIVRLLDKFTLYKSELAAELAARLQQYEYYRDQLLTFDDTVKRVKLGEVGKMQYGYPFNASLFTDEKNDKPIIRIRDVVPAYANTYYNGNVDDLENYIIRRGDMLVGMDGYFNMAKWNDDNAYLNQRVCKISTANSKVVLDGFLFHFLKPTFKIIEQNTAGGSVIHLSAKVINNILIPLPPLSEQERIVSILDRFDKLCHDIREGLPAEIELRQKQYEYYRDKLLTFG